MDDGDDEESDEEEEQGAEYWTKYKQQEESEHLRRKMRQGQELGQAMMGIGRGRRVREGAHMSGIEQDTVGRPGGTTAMGDEHSGKREERPLRDLYNFKKTTGSGERRLHIHEERERIVDVIQNNRVSIITGHTGCGKTTQIPQFILDHYAMNRPADRVNIVVTQPRRIAAASVARRVCDERGWEVGKPVGYKIGMDREHSFPETRILYCTTGVLKKMIIGRKTLSEWTHVILDEVSSFPFPHFG